MIGGGREGVEGMVMIQPNEWYWAKDWDESSQERSHEVAFELALDDGMKSFTLNCCKKHWSDGAEKGVWMTAGGKGELNCEGGGGLSHPVPKTWLTRLMFEDPKRYCSRRVSDWPSGLHEWGLVGHGCGPLRECCVQGFSSHKHRGPCGRSIDLARR
jgi:hypothetical protein